VRKKTQKKERKKEKKVLFSMTGEGLGNVWCHDGDKSRRRGLSVSGRTMVQKGQNQLGLWTSRKLWEGIEWGDWESLQKHTTGAGNTRTSSKKPTIGEGKKRVGGNV